MSLAPYPVPVFGGLNLLSDPEEVGATGAIDLLNVDLDVYGRVKSRDGYGKFTAASAQDRYRHLTPYYASGLGSYQLLATTSPITFFTIGATALNTSGTVLSTDAPAAVLGQGVAFGDATNSYVYFATTGATQRPLRYDGATWSSRATMPFAKYLAVQSPDNRMVAARIYGTSDSAVLFSNAGAAETFNAADFVLITPGDGQSITGIASWRELVFVFKETKFAVFTGNSVSGTGTPIFNYRLVDAGIGTPGLIGAVCSGRPGVFILNGRGVYLTTGGEPRLISRALDPLFIGDLSYAYSGLGVNNAALGNTAAMCWFDERLYVALPTGTSGYNDRLFVWHSVTDSWTVWDIPVAAMTAFRRAANQTEELHFSYATGTNDIGYINRLLTTDDGVAIPTHYQSGFYEPSPGMKTTTRWTKLWGNGAPRLDIFTDHATSDPFSRGGTVTLGTAPAVAKGYHLKSYQGELFSFKLSSTEGAWSVNRLEHDMAFAFQPQ